MTESGNGALSLTTGGHVLSNQIAANIEDVAPQVSTGTEGVQKATSSELLSLILESLDEDGASDIVSIPLQGKSSEADSMVIASGRSTRHVAAVAEKLIERLKQEAGVVPRSEGKSAADWVLIDAGDVIVHLFRPEVRDFYQLEKMWMPAADSTARTASS